MLRNRRFKLGTCMKYGYCLLLVPLLVLAQGCDSTANQQAKQFSNDCRARTLRMCQVVGMNRQECNVQLAVCAPIPTVRR
jgi:hypothetical protein